MQNEIEAEEAKKLNVYEMSFLFTSMRRVFKQDSKREILLKYAKTLSKIEEASSKEDFEKEHDNFCNWFHQNIIQSKRRKGILKYASYGQAAKVLDIMLKVEFYYCRQDSKIVTFLDAAIDTPLLRYLKVKYPNSDINAKSISDIDKKVYLALQELIKNECSSEYENIKPVQYDDIIWRKLNREEVNLP